MSVFDDYEEMASGAIDQLNADGCMFIPMVRKPNGRAQPDPDRETVSCKAVFDYRSGAQPLQVGNRKFGGGNDFRLLANGRVPTVSVRRRYFADGRGPRQGDVVRFPGRDDLPDFDVVSAQPDGNSRIELHLSPRGPADE